MICFFTTTNYCKYKLLYLKILTIILVDQASNTQTFAITPGNYIVVTFLTTLNAAYALANGANIF